MKQAEKQEIRFDDVPVIGVNNPVEDLKIKFETLQQLCDLLSDLINNFDWSQSEKNQLVFTWTQVIKVYWQMCEKLDINPIPKI